MVNSYYTSVKETFPSPTGDLYFSIFIGVVTIVGTSFRPLPGTYISQYFYLAANRGVFSVSVPYRGLIFLNKLFIVSRLLIMVSVPYRGLIFLNIATFFQPHSSVSVPYRGLIFLNEVEFVARSCTREPFPSPTGDLYFSIPSPQFLVNTDCITQFAWEMIFQKYKFIFHYKKLSKCLFYAVRGKTNIF